MPDKHAQVRLESEKRLDKLSKAVVTTLGPFGRNVIIEKENELPQSKNHNIFTFV
jgi:chaperonin GroEL (HSP60 family)